MVTRPMTKDLYALLSTPPDVIETGLSLTKRYFSVLLHCNIVENHIPSDGDTPNDKRPVCASLLKLVSL
jgi:hypothetical protein